MSRAEDNRNPYRKTHPKEELSLELNFRSFMAGEGEAFLTSVPVDDLVTFAAVGAPVAIPKGFLYSEDELKQVARAARRGGSTLTLLGASMYPQELLEGLEKEAPGQLRLE